MARPRDIGTRAETAVVKVLRAHGFPQAERRALRGTADAGDITGTPGLCWEVKGGDAARRASDAQIIAWCAETEIERLHAGADYGILVVQRAGIGPANAHRWWAVIPAADLARIMLGNARHPLPPAPDPHILARLHLGDLLRALRAAGYGEPLNDPDIDIDTKE